VLEEVGFTRAVPIAASVEGERASQIVMLARGPEIEAPAADTGDGIGAATNEPETVEPEPGDWLIFADATGVAQDLANRLTARGERCVLVRPGDGFRRIDNCHVEIAPESPEDMEELLGLVGAGEPHWRGAVQLWSLDGPPPELLTNDALRRMTTLGCCVVMHLVQALERRALPAGSTQVILVTRGAQSIGGEMQPTCVDQAPLVGLGRVITNECPALRCKAVDLDPDRQGDDVAALLAELGTDDPDEETAWRHDARFVPRVERARTPRVGVVPEAEGRARRPRFRLETSSAGVIDRLVLQETRRRPPGSGQVEVEVRAASLNFRDVMKALGVYPGDTEDAVMLGDELSGVVVAVGKGVERFGVGDEVIAIAPHSFASHATTHADCLMPKPPHLTFEQAATIPIAFATAYHALHDVAGIRPGERVLVHAAAGGVGLAAIQIARHLGAEVFATAGSPEKRELLGLLGVRHVMDSRSLAFADQVMDITGGAGVDVVLNSLAGHAIRKGVDCLAPSGRFVELGKRDIYENRKLGLWAFRNNLSFCAVDLGPLILGRGARFTALIDAIGRLIAAGAVTPLPHRTFPVAQIVDAFQHMAQARHIGKVVVRMDDDDVRVRAAEERNVSFRRDRTYLIAGGFGGFGLAVARWVVERGARHVVLMGRSGAASEEAREAVTALRQAGVWVLEAKADVADEGDVAAVLAEVKRTLPPLAGIFMVAGVVDDALLIQLDRARMMDVLRPKIEGSWNLHRHTLDQPLDFFVLFSSVASVVGSPGQANYVAANAFQDAFAAFRRSQGLPAMTINWGHLGEVGYTARNPEVADFLARRGVLPFSPQQAMHALGWMLRRNPAQVGIAPMDWGRWAAALGGARLSQRLSGLAGNGAAGPQSSEEQRARVREAIQRAAPSDREDILQSYVREQVARVMAISAATLDPERPLNEMGLDSLMAVELKNRIEGDLGLSLPTGELLKAPTAQGLARVVLRQLGLPAGHAGNGSASDKRQPAEQGHGRPLRCLVSFRTTGRRPPLFCMHDYGGQVGIYRKLVEALPANIPVYGLQSPLVEGARQGYRTFAEMAADYTRIIRAQQPHGPYHFFGFSLGGFSVMSVARLLERGGERVAFVGMVDCDPRWSDPASPKGPLLRNVVMGSYLRIEREFGILEPLGPERLREEAGRVAERLLSCDAAERLDCLTDWIRSGRYLRKDVPATVLEEYLRPFVVHSDLVSGFEPERIDAPLFVWWAGEQLGDEGRAEGSWQRLADEVAFERTIDATHFALMDPPVVELLARELSQSLELLRPATASDGRTSRAG
jgi:NADPH:quinone reductase-like Zn-dependent oxidoreductase/thioesterase domain-containing protein/acyl carrier protein